MHAQGSLIRRKWKTQKEDTVLPFCKAVTVCKACTFQRKVLLVKKLTYISAQNTFTSKSILENRESCKKAVKFSTTRGRFLTRMDWIGQNSTFAEEMQTCNITSSLEQMFEEQFLVTLHCTRVLKLTVEIKKKI